MTSVAHNGFGCPYCRTAMAEDQDDDEEDDEDEDDEDDFEDDEDALRGFRFFMNNISGIDHSDEDHDAENELEEIEREEQAQRQAIIDRLPSMSYVSRKLQEAGITIEHLIQARLAADHEEFSFIRDIEHLDNSIYRKISDIIGNYAPDEAVLQPEPEVARIDYSAQPKHAREPALYSMRIHV